MEPADSDAQRVTLQESLGIVSPCCLEFHGVLPSEENPELDSKVPHYVFLLRIYHGSNVTSSGREVSEVRRTFTKTGSHR